MCFAWKRDNAKLQQPWGGFVAFYNSYLAIIGNNKDYPSVWKHLQELTDDVELACSWAAPTASHILVVVLQCAELCGQDAATAREARRINRAIARCFREKEDNPKLQELWLSFVDFYNGYLQNGTGEWHVSTWQTLQGLTRETEQV
ncbi:hypothetical protein ACCS93_39395 [Rhizobium ruizarguesonis]